MLHEPFTQPVMDLIEARSSRRSYESRPLEIELRTAIVQYLETQTVGPLGHKVRFQLIEGKNPQALNKARLGTYGFIKNAKDFIVGALEPGSGYRHWEDFGYLMEKIILKMTDYKLGTCWMGGTFKRSEFGKAIGSLDSEIVPAVTPIGYPTQERSLRDRFIRWGAKSRSRKPWSGVFFEEDFRTPLKRELIGKYAVVLEMVRLAPSASNKQPWRIIRRDDCFHFFLQRVASQFGHTKSIDLQRIDMGIAMCHFGLTAFELGLGGHWEDSRPDIQCPQRCEYCISWKKTLSL